MFKKLRDSLMIDFWKFKIKSLYLIIGNGLNVSFPDTKLINGNKRMSLNCFIYQITKDGDLVKKIKFFNLGNIKEVRVYNGKDYGLSL
jgi:hypothetical protein